MLIKGKKYPQIGIANKAKNGEDYYQRIGSIGGSRRGDELNKPKGFAANRELARIAGARGGTISRKSGPHKLKESI